MLPFKHRLKEKKSFNSVFRNGKMVSGDVLVVKFWVEPKKEIRVGFSVGLKFSKKSFRRNKIKRWMREAVRKNIKKIKPGSQILFIINSKYPYDQLCYDLICDETEKMLKKAKILQ